MILTREIEIKISERNYAYYENLGYDITIGEKIIIPIELLPRHSHYKITCKCDNCGVEKKIIYKNYLNYKNEKWGEYYCRKCSEFKRKKTLKKNYKVEYPIQNKEIHNKMKNTLLKKYGVDNISKKKTNKIRIKKNINI